MSTDAPMDRKAKHVGGPTCPFCGADGSYPADDAWWCPQCKRQRPTIAYKCRQPDCWEFAMGDFCKQHTPNHAT